MLTKNKNDKNETWIHDVDVNLYCNNNINISKDINKKNGL